MKTLRVLAGIGALCVACFLVLCTIKNDNGSLAPTGPTSPSGPGATIAPYLMVVPDSLYVGLKETLAVTVTVMTDSIHNDPLANARVICTPSDGWVSAETLYTSAKGRAVFKMMDTAKAVVNLLFTCGQSTTTLSIEVTNTPDKIEKAFLIIPSRAILKADGADNTTINVTLKDENNNPIVGQCIQFISSAGMIMGSSTGCSGSGQSATNSQGVAEAVLTSANVNDTAFVTAYLVSDKTKNAQTKVVFSGVSIALHDDSTSLKLSGQTTITAVLTNGSNAPIPYAPIQFILGNGTASNLSIVSKDTVTGTSGNAQCVIKGKASGKDSVRVSAAGAMSATMIIVTDLTLSISLDNMTLPPDPTKSSLLHAMLSSYNGSPLAGKTIQIKRSYKQINGADTSDYLSATTDSAGKCAIAIFALSYECVMTLEVTAFNSATDLAVATTSLSIVSTRALVATAVPPVLNADGMSQSVITVQEKNSINNPIVGDSILFTTNAGLITGVGITDNNGNAITTLTSDRRNTTATIRATMAKDLTKFITIQVQFSGVQLTATANPLIINANGNDSSTISMSLVDGANNPIAGDTITFLPLPAKTFISMPNSLTNALGNGICKVYGMGSGTDTITLEAAGASANVVIQYASNHIIIGFDPNNPSTCIANGTDITHLLIKYLQGDATTPIGNATINVSMSLGSISSTSYFAQQYTLTPSNNGTIPINITNPAFPDSATVFVYAVTSSEATSATFKFYFKSLPVANIVLTATPSMVALNGDKSVLTAIAFDAKGNRVASEQVSFNLIAGPGTGEYIDPPVVATTVDGIATANFVSGSTMSKFRGVGIVASSINGIKSDSVYLTIAGPPFAIALGTNVISPCPRSPNVDTAVLIDNNDGMWGLRVGALVGDANGNPVADGTPVNYSLKCTNPNVLILIPRTITTSQGGAGTVLTYPQSFANVPTIGVIVYAECQGLLDSLIIQPLPAAGCPAP